MMRFAGALALVVSVITVWVVRFRHPELTETQLFVEFWYLWLSVAVTTIGGALLVVKGQV